MLELYDQTLKNTINLIDLDVLLHTVQALKKANNIYIFHQLVIILWQNHFNKIC